MKKEKNSNKCKKKNKNNGSLSKGRKKKELTLEDIKDLPLIDNDFFLFAIDNNKELADVLIKPALNYLGIKNYKILSVKAEVYYGNLKNHSVRIDCRIKLESGENILIEIQNGHPEEMPLKRVRYGHGSVDTNLLNKGDDYNNLPDIISLVYTTEPLKYHDTGHTVNDLTVMDVKTGQIAKDYGIRMLIVNGKYKNEDSKEFSDVIEDLQKPNSEGIKSPVIKDIHSKTKNSEKGRTMLSQFIEDRYGDIIRNYEEQLQKEQEQHLKDQEEIHRNQEQLREAQEEIKRCKNLMKQNGLIPDGE